MVVKYNRTGCVAFCVHAVVYSYILKGVFVMIPVGKIIAAERIKNGLSREALAERLGIATETLARYERGDRSPKIEIIAKLCEIFNVSADYFANKSEDTKKAPTGQTAGEGTGGATKEDRLETVHHINNETIEVPVYEDFMAVCAGQGTYGVEGNVREKLMIPVWLLGGSYTTEVGLEPFIVTIQGDSMTEANIPDGSQVLVNPMLEAHDGDVIVAEYFGDWMLKWIYWDRNGGGELRSASTKYPPRRFTREDVDNGNFRYKGRVCRVLNTPLRGE